MLDSQVSHQRSRAAETQQMLLMPTPQKHGEFSNVKVEGNRPMSPIMPIKHAVQEFDTPILSGFMHSKPRRVDPAS
jgi:hypothetical protein